VRSRIPELRRRKHQALGSQKLPRFDSLFLLSNPSAVHTVGMTPSSRKTVCYLDVPTIEDVPTIDRVAADDVPTMDLGAYDR